MDILDKISLKIQRGNWKPYIEERQTIQWPKEDRQYNGQKKKDRQYNGQKKTENTMDKRKKRTKYKHPSSKHHT